MTRLYLSVITLLFIVVLNPLYAQPRTGQFIDVSAGLGIVAPNDDESDLDGSGFYAQVEYVYSPRTWFGIRPYAGVIIASGETDNLTYIRGSETRESIKSNAFLLGGKIRIAAPIPYVAPFFETGIGVSIGSLRTVYNGAELKRNTVMHIPVTIGLAIGHKHTTEIKFTYYFHEYVKQFSGAMAVGFSIPIDKN